MTQITSELPPGGTALGLPLGTVAFLQGGEYFGVQMFHPQGNDAVVLDGVATSFVATRPVRMTLSGEFVGQAFDRAASLASGVGGVWELDGRVAGELAFPFFECEIVPMSGGPDPAVFGGLVRIMSEYGEQRCLYLTACDSLEALAVLAACAVMAAALPTTAWHSLQSTPELVSGLGEITIVGAAATTVRGEIAAG